VKKNLLIVLSFVLILGLIGCESGKTATETQTDPISQNTTDEVPSEATQDEQELENVSENIVVDALNREVVIPNEVNKIIALGNVPRMATYLELAESVVGFSGMEPEKVTPLTAYAYVNREVWQDVPIVGTDAMGNTDYYPETIIELEPDVIICSYPLNVVEDLEMKTGLPVISVATGNIFSEDYNQALTIIAQVCGVEARASSIFEYLDQSLEDLDSRTKDIPDDQKPSVISAAATFKGAHGIEGVRIRDSVLAAINANNVAFSTLGNEQTEAAVEVDREQILLWNPEYIFCDYGGVELVKNDQQSDPDFYNQLQAYQANTLIQHPSSTSYYANLEISLANAYYLGSVLYPEQFSDIDIETKIEEIFEFFLGKQTLLTDLEEIGAYYGPIVFE